MFPENQNNDEKRIYNRKNISARFPVTFRKFSALSIIIL
jgi:hypothetical protein